VSEGHDKPTDPFGPEPWGAPALALQALSRVRLDQLLVELLDRVHEVMADRDRLSALLEAVVGIGRDLDLHSTLQRIVVAACRLAEARYGALGVVGPDGMLVDFITHGVTDEERRRIGEYPRGRGVLGLLIDEPEPLRLAEIATHARSFGFPPNHPIMHTFLGVPIRIRGHSFGNLYLTEKRDGYEFTPEDEQMVVALAAAAGVAIDNARLYAAAGYRQRWLEATAEITRLLLEEVDRAGALELVARRALEVSGAGLALILLRDPDAQTLTVEVAVPEAGALEGVTVPAGDGLLAGAMDSAQPVMARDLRTAADWPVEAPEGPALVAPLAASGSVMGLLVLVHAPGSARFDDHVDVNLLSTFAGQAALALERERAQQEKQELQVLEERERIARDLHDVVIQRLFATGLQLQSLAKSDGDMTAARTRIERTVDELDTTIREIRSAIFELRSPAMATIRSQTIAMVDAAASSLGFRPQLRFNGPIDSTVPDEVRADLLASLREALSNVVKHARATAVLVELSVADHMVTLTVADDGVGSPDALDERSGLINLRDRADRHGGSLTLLPSRPTGITLRWTAPL